ncbi:hypothetical protein MSG28_005314 [Choristoneura fumiferana]|uniref:Uncharacterized protein n=1 Tax=Choristoneura fumiferana TaxID=7141 RepID=A0ACC0JQR5_CHOFU|nr:hypothetical protein MSG28_005314 [Choristoneura fumiferana]
MLAAVACWRPSPWLAIASCCSPCEESSGLRSRRRGAGQPLSSAVSEASLSPPAPLSPHPVTHWTKQQLDTPGFGSNDYNLTNKKLENPDIVTSKFNHRKKTCFQLKTYCIQIGVAVGWRLGEGLERHAGAFAARGVDGALLLALSSADLKLLGLGGDDRRRMKRRLKELRAAHEKHLKALKKAEKKAKKK